MFKSRLIQRAVIFTVFTVLAALSHYCFSFVPRNPLLIFDEFWQAFDDNYAFFDLRGVDWRKQRDRYRSKVTAATSEDELYRIFCDMVDPLDDGHVSLWRNGTRFRSGDPPVWKQSSAQIQATIADKYLAGKVVRTGAISYGLINPATGYINIGAMEGFDPSAIDEALQGMTTIQKIIVDVRFNGGGYDATALALASRFADKKRLVYSKRTYYKGQYGDEKDLYISPVGATTGSSKIIVLTSRATASAAEMFVMAMTALPNVTIVGEETMGMHSDVFTIDLSNGWRIGLSNQEYKMPDGKVYEKYGLPPDVRIPMADDIQVTKKDPILERAIAYE